MLRNSLMASILILGLASTTGHAADTSLYTNADKSFTLTGGVGVMNIDAGEFVYSGDYTVSRLDWTSRGIALFTVNGTLELPHEIQLKASVSTGIGGDGHMVDYDWIYPGNNGPNGLGDWTDRSISPDTDLDHYWAATIELSKPVYSTDDTSLSLGGGFKYTDVKWTAYGGSYIYTRTTFRDSAGDFPDGEKGISYRQQIPVLYASAAMSHDMGNWTLGAGLKGGLSLGIEDVDDHWMRDLRFYDSIEPAPMLGTDLSVAYNVNENTAFYLAGGVEKVFRKVGDTEIVDTLGGTRSTEENGAGADFQSMQVSFGLKMKF